MIKVSRLLLIVFALLSVSAAFHRVIPSAFRSEKRTALNAKTPDQNEFNSVAKVIEKKFQIGRSIKFGISQQEIDSTKIGSLSERSEMIKNAEDGLTNIDNLERGRRKLIGQIFAGISVLAYSSALYVHAPIFIRAIATYLPVAVSVGFLQSGKDGLWNIAQGGLWDVDGTGVQRIKSSGIANALLDKTNKMNLKIGVKAVGISALLTVIPELFHFISNK